MADAGPSGDGRHLADGRPPADGRPAGDARRPGDARVPGEGGSGPISCPAIPAGATVGLVARSAADSFDGYTLLAPLSSTTTYLIDPCGREVHRWSGTYLPGNAVYLLENGNLLRTGQVPTAVKGRFETGGSGGIVQEIDWGGKLVWEYRHATDTYHSHHDARRLPSGNTLIVSWEYKTRDQAIAAGRDPAKVTQSGLWPDYVFEIRPGGASGGTIVWEWHSWDHLVQNVAPAKQNYGTVAEHPERIDVNFSTAKPDFMHVNAVDYDAELDQVMLSSRELSEVWILDHGTTTAEAASTRSGKRGQGGDLLFRLGNQQSYGAGTVADQLFFGQHNAQWIASGLAGAGHLLVFNNGNGRLAGKYSSINEIVLPLDGAGNFPPRPAAGSPWGTLVETWTYVASPPTTFYSDHISGVQRLPGGNTLICSGVNGWIFEVTPSGKLVWQYYNPVTSTGPVTQGTPRDGLKNSVFRAYRYASSYAGLTGRTLTPGEPIER
jgi:hypothetical protein